MSSQPDIVDEVVASSEVQDLEVAYQNANVHLPRPNQTSGFHKTIRLWFRPLMLAHRIPVFKRVWLYVAAMAAYTCIVDLVAADFVPAHLFKELGAVSSSGIILGLLLVFRTNSAYERWWEGRKLWGQLVNDSRNLCIKIRAIEGISATDKVHFAELVISFSYALKHHLRDTTPTYPLPGVGALNNSDAKNIPVHIASRIYDKIMGWRKEGFIDGLITLQLDTHAQALMNITGSCERIKNSPIAISYRAFMRQGIALNLLVLPWYMSQQVTIWCCLPIILICTYFLVGIELIAEDVEDPFGYDGNHLPLDNICAGIRETVSQILKVHDDRKFTRSMVKPRVDLLR